MAISVILLFFHWWLPLILIIASINYMNLSTARSSLRVKEIGVRKVSGSRKGAAGADVFSRIGVNHFYCLWYCWRWVYSISALPWFQHFIGKEMIHVANFGVWQTILLLDRVFRCWPVASAASTLHYFLSGFQMIPFIKRTNRQRIQAILYSGNHWWCFNL